MADYEARVRVTADTSPVDREIRALERRLDRPVNLVVKTAGFNQAQRSLAGLQKSIGDLNKTPLNILSGRGAGSSSKEDVFRQLSKGAKDFFNEVASGGKSLASTTAGLRQQAAAFRDLADNINFVDKSQKRFFRDFTQGAEMARVRAGRATMEQLGALKDLYQSGTGGFKQDINPTSGGLFQLLNLGKDLPRTKAALSEYRSELERVFDLVETRSLSGGIIATELSNVEKELLKIERDRAEANDQINNIKKASYALTGKQLSLEEENLAAIERRTAAMRQAQIAANDLYSKSKSLSRDFGVSPALALRPAGVSDEQVARQNLISDRTRAAAEASVFNAFSRQATEIEKGSATLGSINRNRRKIEAETLREAQEAAKSANQASARGRAAEFRRTGGLSFDERLARVRPDLVPGYKKPPGLFRGSLRQGIGEGLIGGAFPLLFGQGLGASAGGLAGGFGGGLIGGSFGFGLSLIGTAVGGALDTTANNLKELAGALKSPNDALNALEKSGFNVSDSLDLQVKMLQDVGRAYDAQTLVLREVEKRLGGGAVKELNALNGEQKKLEESWAVLAGNIQRAVIPAVIGLTAILNDFVNFINSIKPQRDAAGKTVDTSRRNYRFNPFTGRLEDAGARERSRGRVEKIIAAAPSRVALNAGQAYEAETKRIDESRQLADKIQSAYREAFSLQRRAYDLQRDGADINREIADYGYRKQREIFELQQQVADKEIENTRAAAQNRIERGDLSARQTFAAAVGFEQQLLSNVRETMRTRMEGEADIEQSRRRLELAMARLSRDAEDYKRTNAREIEDIERRKLAYIRSVEDYKMQVADYVLQRSREAADYSRQSAALAGTPTGGGGGGTTGGGVGGTGGGASNGSVADRLLQAANSRLGLFAGQTERCADAMRELFKVAGVAIGTTKKAWDGLASGPRLASSFFGSDVGQRINRKEDLRPGDLVGFERTYGGWGPGVQTHVGMYAGGGMMYDHSSRRGLVKRPLDTFAGKFMYGVRPSALGMPPNIQGQASAQISSIPVPTFKPTPIGPTPSAAPASAANAAAYAALGLSTKDAQRISEEQIKLRQKGIELGQIEQILQANQLPQLQQQYDTLKLQMEARRQNLSLSDQAATIADTEAEATTRIAQIEKDRKNALAGVQKQYGNNLELQAQVNRQADLALNIAREEEKKRIENIELNNRLQGQERARVEILQMQEALSIAKVEAAALENGQLQASSVELMKASTLYQQAEEAQQRKLVGLATETEELRKQNEFRRQMNEMQRDTGLVGAGLRAGFIGAGARAFEQGLRDFNGDTTKAADLAKQSQLLENQRLVWDNLEKSIVGVSDAISGALTNGLVDIANGSKKIEDVGRDMLNNMARSFADAAQQQLTALLQRQLAGAMGGLLGGGAPAAAGGGILGSLLGAPSVLPGFTPSFTFGGFLANGGDAKVGEAYVVGENEPEFFFPGVNGRVVPKSEMEKVAGLRRANTKDDPIDINYTVTEQAGQRFVTEEQLRKSNAAVMLRARAATYAGMRNSRDVRDYVGMD